MEIKCPQLISVPPRNKMLSMPAALSGQKINVFLPTIYTLKCMWRAGTFYLLLRRSVGFPRTGWRVVTPLLPLRRAKIMDFSEHLKKVKENLKADLFHHPGNSQFLRLCRAWSPEWERWQWARHFREHNQLTRHSTQAECETRERRREKENRVSG